MMDKERVELKETEVNNISGGSSTESLEMNLNPTFVVPTEGEMIPIVTDNVIQMVATNIAEAAELKLLNEDY